MWLKAFTTLRAPLCIPWENYVATHVVCRGWFFDDFVRRVLTFYLYQIVGTCTVVIPKRCDTTRTPVERRVYMGSGELESFVYLYSRSWYNWYYHTKLSTCTSMCNEQAWTLFHTVVSYDISCTSWILATGHWFVHWYCVLYPSVHECQARCWKTGVRTCAWYCTTGTTNSIHAGQTRKNPSFDKTTAFSRFLLWHLLSVGVVIDPMAYS